ncbi:MAG: hypothetical protein KDC48_07300 [Planctomycetes bacterium]|nr:hypothetical protein [Planctomycetota bacterium]
MTVHAFTPTRIRFRAGCVEVSGWPGHLTPPFGLVDTGSLLQGPARLRWRVRQALAHAGCPYRDETHLPVVMPMAESPRSVSLRPNAAAAASALRLASYRGVVAGLPEPDRVALSAGLTKTLAAPALVVVVDSGAAQRWRGQPVETRTLSAVAADVHWLGARHDVLIVDDVERMPSQWLERVLDGSAALARVGFSAQVDWRVVSRLASGLGPVVHIASGDAAPVCHELRVPLPPEREPAYERAWSTFLAAFDRFAAARPDAGFGSFVAQARHDPLQRPALSAWHEALRVAAWHEHKAAVVGELLRRHRGQRVLVFTPDRCTAYQLASEHLVAAVTAEVPARERAELLRAFAAGALQTLVGPRLLDLGVAEGAADVAILVGGGFGREQRRARCRRVRPDGVVYELVSADTVEVGRAHRWRDVAAVDAAVVHPR